MKIKNFIKLLMVLALSISVVGCSDKLEEDLGEENTDQTKVVQIIDHLGREVEFEKPAERIVSSYYITTSMLLSLGLKDQIVGIEAKADKRPIYKLAAPELLDLPSVGTMKEFDLEGAAALEPDLIIMSVRLKDAVETMENLGLKVIAVNPENTKLLNESLEMIAKATGRESQAKELIDYNAEKIAKVTTLTKNQPAKDVYLGGNSSFLLTASKKMYQNTLIELAGANNVAAEIDDTYWANISYEQLIAYNPDVIIGVPGTEYTKDDLLGDDKLQGLKAIENKEVYFMPSGFENWDSPIPSGVLGTLWLTSVLHEDLYSFEKFKDDVFEFYQNFYGFQVDKNKITK